MPTLKRELTSTDLNVLHYYADNGMRERYWNYLANDTKERYADNGYGTLAMTVVRNDAMPGRIANNYAQNYVENHPINGKNLLNEREWEKVGVDLIRADLKQRQDLYDSKRPDLALNLPVEKVYESHIKAFKDNGIDPKAWTPAVLIDASFKNTGNFAQSNQIWRDMLNSDYLGLERVANVLQSQYGNGKLVDSYTANQAKAYAEAGPDLPYNTPDAIRTTEPNAAGKLENHWYKKIGSVWLEGHATRVGFVPLPYATTVDHTKSLHLDSILELRNNRNQLSVGGNRHPSDLNREITPSKQTISDNSYGRDTNAAAVAFNATQSGKNIANTEAIAQSQGMPHIKPEGGYPKPNWTNRSVPQRLFNDGDGTSKLFTLNSDGFIINTKELDVHGVEVSPKPSVDQAQQINLAQQMQQEPKQLEMKLSMNL